MTRNPRRIWWSKPARTILLGLTGLVLFGALGLKLASKTGLKRELQALRAKGLPTNLKELDKWYAAVPEEENAALAFLKAFESHVEPREGNDPSLYSGKDMPHGEPLLPAITAAAEEYVAKNQETLAQVHRAAGLQRSRYPTDLSTAPNFSLTHLMCAKRLAQLLRWEAMVKAERGDAEAAFRSLMSGYAVASSLDDEPLVISELVRMACLAIHLQALEWTVNRVRLDDASLAELARQAHRVETAGKRAIHRAFIGERAFGLGEMMELNFESFAQSLAWGTPVPGYDKLPEVLQRVAFQLRRAIGMHHQDVAFYLRSMGELERATALEFPEMLRETKAVFAEINRELNAHPIKYMISKQTLPAMEKIAQKEALLASRLRCVRAALEIERHRRSKHGKLPAEEELVPERFETWPLDAVDGTPLQYERGETNGFRMVASSASKLANEWRAKTSTNWQDVAFGVR